MTSVSQINLQIVSIQANIKMLENISKDMATDLNETSADLCHLQHCDYVIKQVSSETLTNSCDCQSKKALSLLKINSLNLILKKASETIVSLSQHLTVSRMFAAHLLPGLSTTVSLYNK